MEDCEEDVENPRSLEEARSVGVCCSSYDRRGNADVACERDLGESFLRRKLG